MGMVPAGSVPPGSQAVVVPGLHGQAVMAMVPVHSVYTQDPNDPKGSPVLAGYQIAYNVGGKQIAMWGYKDAQGANHWSLNSPIAAGATTSVDNKGDVYITPGSMPNPLARAAQIDAQFGTNLVAQIQAAGGGDASATGKTFDTKHKGTIQQEITVSYHNGVFSASRVDNTVDPATGHITGSMTTNVPLPGAFGPQGAAFAPSRLAAGDIPGITFNSPLQASVTAASSTQNADQVSKFASDPAFQQAFLAQTMQTLGTDNPFDARLAQAWKKITTPTAPQFGGQSPDERIHLTGKQRDDLVFPGEKPNPAYQGSLTVNFGQGELRLPGLPSYLGQQNANLSQFGAVANGLFSGLSTMLPGLGLSPVPSQTATGSPAPSVTPTVTPTGPAPGATANITPTTPVPPAPTATVLPGLPPPPPPPKPGQGSKVS